MLLDIFIAIFIGILWSQIISHWGASILLHRYYCHKQFKVPVWFETIGLAKVSKSAMEAKDLLFITGDHGITMNRKRLLADAKKLALKLSNNYIPPSKNEEINLPGPSAKTAIELATGDLARLGKISNYDLVVTRELANILSGGDTDFTEKVSENDLLKLELKSIARLIKNHPTLDRIEHMLKTGKPLRN